MRHTIVFEERMVLRDCVWYTLRGIRWIFGLRVAKKRKFLRERLAQDCDTFNKLKTLFKFVLTFTYLRIQKRLSTFQERFCSTFERERRRRPRRPRFQEISNLNFEIDFHEKNNGTTLVKGDTYS